MSDSDGEDERSEDENDDAHGSTPTGPVPAPTSKPDVEAAKDPDGSNQNPQFTQHEQIAVPKIRPTQDGETQTENKYLSKSTDQQYKTPSKSEPMSGENHQQLSSTAGGYTRDEGTQTDDIPEGTSTDQGSKPPSEFDMTDPQSSDKNQQSTSPHHDNEDEDMPSDSESNNSADEEQMSSNTHHPLPSPQDKPGTAIRRESELKPLGTTQNNAQQKPGGSHAQDGGGKKSSQYNKNQLIGETPYYAKTNTLRQHQLHDQRNVEAIKDMLYRVFENVVMTIEVYEERTDSQDMPSSQIQLPDQSWKSDEDVKTNVEAQLLVFEAHKSACPSDVTNKEIRMLRHSVIQWAAPRKELTSSATDHYIAQLYEILVKGQTHHAIVDQLRQPTLKSTIQETLQHIMDAQEKATQLGKSYEKDSDKKAECPKTRICTSENAAYGAKRINDVKSGLENYLFDDLLDLKVPVEMMTFLLK